MPHYFLVLDGPTFEERLRPPLTQAWLGRDFGPCRALASELLPAAADYARAYHTGPTESLLAAVVAGLPFDRACWRALVGEVILFAAAEIPEIPFAAAALCCLLAPEQWRDGITDRSSLAPIQQVHRGSRDLTFGPGVYRPDHAGYNNAADVARLATYLKSVDPSGWQPSALAALPDAATDEDREDELAYARQCFAALIDTFRRATQQGRVIVHESMY